MWNNILVLHEMFDLFTSKVDFWIKKEMYSVLHAFVLVWVLFWSHLKTGSQLCLQPLIIIFLNFPSGMCLSHNVHNWNCWKWEFQSPRQPPFLRCKMALESMGWRRATRTTAFLPKPQAHLGKPRSPQQSLLAHASPALCLPGSRVPALQTNVSRSGGTRNTKNSNYFLKCDNIRKSFIPQVVVEGP